MKNITIKELYKIAKSYGVENDPLILNYFCTDDYYGFEGYNVQVNDVTIEDDRLQISIANDNLIDDD